MSKNSVVLDQPRGMTTGNALPLHAFFARNFIYVNNHPLPSPLFWPHPSVHQTAFITQALTFSDGVIAYSSSHKNCYENTSFFVLMTNRCTIIIINFYSTVFLFALHVSNESSRSSSGARHNILYYTVWYNRYNRAGESSCLKAARLACTIVPIVLCSWRWTARFVRKM